MLAFRADLHGIEETITRNVLIKVVNDVKQLLGMSKDVYTIFDEKDTVVKKKSGGDVRGNNTFKEDMFNVDFTESTEEGFELSLLPLRPDSKHIYYDKDIGSSITPVYICRKMEIKIKYSNKSKSKIFAIANKLRLFGSNDGMYKQHELEYHYTIPNFVNKLLMEINNLKNTRIDGADKLTLEQYIDNNFDDRVDFSHTLDGNINKTELVIREAQLAIEGYITDDVHSITPEYDDSFNTWYLEFTYGLTYEKPVSIVVKYPILVYNNLINKQFRNFLPKDKHINKAVITKGRGDMVELTTRDTVFNIRDNGYYIRLPEYDTDIMPLPTTFISRMFSVLVVLDVMDPTMLFNLDEIPTIKFKDSFKEFILQEHKYVGDSYQSLVHIELFKNDKKDYNNKILMDDKGNLITESPMDYKAVYRVMFNIVNDVNKMSLEAKDRFVKFARTQFSYREEKPSPSFQESYSYWAGVDYRKYNTQIKTDNIITDYLTLLQVDGSVVTNAILNSNKFYDIPFKVTQTNGKRAKTVMANGASTASAILTKK